MEHALKLGNKVKIIPLENQVGVVTCIQEDFQGKGYKVRYFNQGKAEEVFFFDWELEV